MACDNKDCKCEQGKELPSTCIYCETDPAADGAYLCPDCLVGNEINLLMKCRKCNSNSNFYMLEVNCYDVMCTRIRSGYTKQGDIVWTGSGFLIWTDECPACEKDRVKRETSARRKSAWEQAENED